MLFMSSSQALSLPLPASWCSSSSKLHALLTNNRQSHPPYTCELWIPTWQRQFQLFQLIWCTVGNLSVPLLDLFHTGRQMLWGLCNLKKTFLFFLLMADTSQLETCVFVCDVHKVTVYCVICHPACPKRSLPSCHPKLTFTQQGYSSRWKMSLPLMQPTESLFLPAGPEVAEVFTVGVIKLWVLSGRVLLIHCGRDKVTEKPISDVRSPRLTAAAPTRYEVQMLHNYSDKHNWPKLSSVLIWNFCLKAWSVRNKVSVLCHNTPKPSLLPHRQDSESPFLSHAILIAW